MAVATAPPSPLRRPRVVMMGTIFASAGILTFFAGLLGVYLARRAELVTAGDPWLPTKVGIPLQQPTVMLFTLAASCVTVQWAVYAVARNDRRNTYLALGITLVFGIAFINMASYLFSLMGLDVAANQQAVLIYTISVAHIIMLITAMVYIGLMALRALGGQETSRQHDGVSAAALFWYATFVVYVIIWLAIYVTK